jgi:hypothetical protein
MVAGTTDSGGRRRRTPAERHAQLARAVTAARLAELRAAQIEAARRGGGGGFASRDMYLVEDAAGVPAALVEVETGAGWGWPEDALAGDAGSN